MASSLQHHFSRSRNIFSAAHNPFIRNELIHQQPVSAQDEVREWDTALTFPRDRVGVTILSRPVVKTLVFRRRLFHSDMSIWHNGEGFEVQEYCVACSQWKKNTPDVTLYAGQDYNGPIVGVAHFRSSRNVNIGVGNPLFDPKGVVWEKMRNVCRRWSAKSKYEFEFTEFPTWGQIEAGTDLPRTRSFRWERIDAAAGIPGTARLSLKNYRLLDQQNGLVAAVFVASTLSNVRKKGELRLFEQLSRIFEVMVVLSCASLSEKLSRD